MGGGQKFLGPRGIKYLNMGLLVIHKHTHTHTHTVISQ